MKLTKTQRKIVATITVGIGSWFVFVFARDMLAPFITNPLANLVVGGVLIWFGISFFKLKGLDY